MFLFRVAALLSLVLFLACGGAAIPHRTSFPWMECARPTLHDGKPHRGSPAVGKLQTIVGKCTGTLIAADVVLTASHCVADSVSRNGYNGTFTLDDGRAFPIAGWFGVGSGVGQNDIAYVILSRSVTGVAPMKVSARDPLVHENLYVVGYGCSDACTDKSGKIVYSGQGTKRIAPFPAAGFDRSRYRSDLFWTCPGDSGGPVVLKETGEIVGVVSGIRIGISGEEMRYTAMIFADPVYVHAQIYGIVTEWRREAGI